MQRLTATMKIKQQPKTTKDATTDAAARSGFRKGPWTEQEDMKLVWFVRRLFGERRWDLLAKVSGLNRTGKSCRLRWVNYLHPDLKRGRMTPDEERRVVDLHATFGNRWSRIAKSMPGRTDNEIKNYWRTHMRKQQHAGKRTSTTAAADDSASTSSTSASSSTAAAASPVTTSSSSSSSNNSDVNQEAATRGAEEDDQEAAPCSQEQILYTAGAAMDQLLIWNDIDWSSTLAGMAAAAPLMPSSPVWDYCSGSLWE